MKKKDLFVHSVNLSSLTRQLHTAMIHRDYEEAEKVSDKLCDLAYNLFNDNFTNEEAVKLGNKLGI